MDKKLRELAMVVTEWPRSASEGVSILRDIDGAHFVKLYGDRTLEINGFTMEQWAHARYQIKREQKKPDNDNALPKDLRWDDAPEWAEALVQHRMFGRVWASSHAGTVRVESCNGLFGSSNLTLAGDWTVIATRPQPAAHEPDPFIAMAQENFDLAREAGESLVNICHRAATKAGWWTDLHTGESLLGKRNVGEMLMLAVSEIAEAMEGHRKSLMDDKLPHRPMIEVEIADCIIRLADTAGALNLDLGGAIAEKLAFNASRADHKPEARKAAGGKAY